MESAIRFQTSWLMETGYNNGKDIDKEMDI